MSITVQSRKILAPSQHLPPGALTRVVKLRALDWNLAEMFGEMLAFTRKLCGAGIRY